MAEYIVVTNAENEPIREAMGRLFAVAIDLGWPIRSTFVSGGIDPDITHSTFYYVDAFPGVNGTHAAFPVDEMVESFIGQTIETSYGPRTIPAKQELEPSWFPPEE